MITLNDKHFIAEGVYQKCYHHPTDANLCIKISKQNVETSRLAYELKYCKSISKKTIQKKDHQFFSKYYGEVETNLGTGYVFDLIKDETTGAISKTLEYYLLSDKKDISDTILKEKFDDLIRLMGKYKVIANDIRAKNICCQILQDQSMQMVHIDGLGHRDFIPVVDWFSFFAKKKVKRRLIKFKMNDLNHHRTYLKKIYNIK